MSLLSTALQASEKRVAEVFSRTAQAVFSGDFVWDPTEQTFSEDELQVLRQYPDELERMICAALNLGHSVVGAKLMAYFGLRGCLKSLRHRFLSPGRFYGWEGTLLDGREHLSDHQYVYHSRYVDTLEALFDGEDLVVALALTQREIDPIRTLSDQEGGQHQEWAIWMLHRLRIEN